jgi:hypothetical protein
VLQKATETQQEEFSNEQHVCETSQCQLTTAPTRKKKVLEIRTPTFKVEDHVDLLPDNHRMFAWWYWQVEMV